MNAMQSGILCTGHWLTHRLPDGPAEIPVKRRHLQRRRHGHRIRAADRAAVHVPRDPGRHRLPRPRRVPHGPPACQGRPARQELHPAAQQLRLRHPRHHGDPHHRKPPRPPGHHSHRPVHELQRPPAGLRAAHRHLLRRLRRLDAGRHHARAATPWASSPPSRPPGSSSAPCSKARRRHSSWNCPATSSRRRRRWPGRSGPTPEIRHQGRHHDLLPQHRAVGDGYYPRLPDSRADDRRVQRTRCRRSTIR